MFSWTKIAAVLSVIGAVIAAMFGYVRGKNANAKEQIDEAKKEGQQATTHAAEVAKVSAETHNQTVAEVSAAKEKINAQAQADRAALSGTDDVSLRAGADTVASAIDRANGGV